MKWKKPGCKLAWALFPRPHGQFQQPSKAEGRLGRAGLCRDPLCRPGASVHTRHESMDAILAEGEFPSIPNSTPPQGMVKAPLYKRFHTEISGAWALIPKPLHHIPQEGLGSRTCCFLPGCLRAPGEEPDEPQNISSPHCNVHMLIPAFWVWTLMRIRSQAQVYWFFFPVKFWNEWYTHAHTTLRFPISSVPSWMCNLEDILHSLKDVFKELIFSRGFYEYIS